MLARQLMECHEHGPVHPGLPADGHHGSADRQARGLAITGESLAKVRRYPENGLATNRRPGHHRHHQGRLARFLSQARRPAPSRHGGGTGAENRPAGANIPKIEFQRAIA